MRINKSSTEGPAHTTLKKAIIELLEKRNDIIKIETEYKIRKEKGYSSAVDVWAKKCNGGEIYVEVKTRSNMGEALGQLIYFDKINNDNEFIIVCNFERLNFFKKLFKDGKPEFQNFVNKTKIYNYNKEYKLCARDVKYIRNKQLWVDGIRIL